MGPSEAQGAVFIGEPNRKISYVCSSKAMTPREHTSCSNRVFENSLTVDLYDLMTTVRHFGTPLPMPTASAMKKEDEEEEI